jgi:hypothetical protein
MVNPRNEEGHTFDEWCDRMDFDLRTLFGRELPELEKDDTIWCPGVSLREMWESGYSVEDLMDTWSEMHVLDDSDGA